MAHMGLSENEVPKKVHGPSCFRILWWLFGKRRNPPRKDFRCFYISIIWTYFHESKNLTRKSCAKASTQFGSGRDSRNGFQHRSFGGYPFAPDKCKSTSYQLGCLLPLYVSHSIPLHPDFCGLNPSFSPVTWDISPVDFPLYPHHSPCNLITSFVSLSFILKKKYTTILLA